MALVAGVRSNPCHLVMPGYIRTTKVPRFKPSPPPLGMECLWSAWVQVLIQELGHGFPRVPGTNTCWISSSTWFVGGRLLSPQVHGRVLVGLSKRSWTFGVEGNGHGLGARRSCPSLSFVSHSECFCQLSPFFSEVAPPRVSAQSQLPDDVPPPLAGRFTRGHPSL